MRYPTLATFVMTSGSPSLRWGCSGLTDRLLEFNHAASTAAVRWAASHWAGLKCDRELWSLLVFYQPSMKLNAAHRAGRSRQSWASTSGPSGPEVGSACDQTATSHLVVVDDSAMPAAFALLDALPADTAATALLVTSHGVKSRPALAGAPRDLARLAGSSRDA